MRFAPWNRVQTGAPIFELMDGEEGSLPVTSVVAPQTLAADTEADPVLIVKDLVKPVEVKEEKPSSFWTTPVGATVGLGGLAAFLVILGSNMGVTRRRRAA